MSEARHIVAHYEDGSTGIYAVPPKVEIRFERDMKMALSDLHKNTDLYRLAWMAAQNADSDVGPFDPWIETVTGIDWVKGEAPLVESPPSGGSLPAPSSQG